MNNFKLIDSYYDKDEITVAGEHELQEALKSFLAHGNRVVVLKSPNSGSLSLGIGEPYGFVEYMNENAEPPYLVATKDKTEVSGAFIEFDAGGTLTPISLDRCLPLTAVLEIAVYFFQKETLPDYVKWQAI